MSSFVPYVAARHGLILAVESTREAAAAAAAARVSRVEVRFATAEELERWRQGRWRDAGWQGTERELLEQIQTDCRRVLFVAACECEIECEHVSDCEHVHSPRLPGYDVRLDAITEDLCDVLKARVEAINAELRELAALERQVDAFPRHALCVTGGAA